jgi:hypothetical protein
MDYSFNPVALAFTADAASKSLTLTATAGNTLKYGDFKTIHFGNSVTDINLCNPASYTYQIKNGVIPDLSGSSATIILSNMA